MLFIAKHFYPKDLFRAPSGAAKRGESVMDGAKREAFEETGVEIELEEYLARIRVKFYCNDNADDFIDWTSHVFKARYVKGDVDPKDTREIRAARFVDLHEIPGFNEIMRESKVGGFHYRAYLTERIMGLLESETAETDEIESKKI